MKEAAYGLRRKLGNSWGLTLIVASTVLQILSSMFLSFPGGIGESMSSSNPFAVMLMGVGALGSMVGLICTGGQITGIVLTIVEKVQLKERWHQMHLERAEAARAAGEIYAMPAKRSKSQLLKDNIGLSLVASSMLISAMGVTVVIGILIFALSTEDIFTGMRGSSLSGIEDTTFIISVIFGVLLILLAGLIFPAGVIVAIVQEVRKRNWMESELAAHYASTAAVQDAGDQQGHEPADPNRSEPPRSQF